MQLDVPLIKQQSIFSCGPACVAMLLSFFGLYNEKQTIIGQLGSDKKMSPPELALAIKRCSSLTPTLVFFNFQYFDESFNKLSKAEKINYVDSLNDVEGTDALFIKNLKEAIINDVSVNFCFFKSDFMQDILAKGTPIITLVSVPEFRKTKTKWRGHFVLITGYDDSYFYYNDPHIDNAKFGKHKMHREEFLISICKTRFPSLIYVPKW